MADIYQHKQMWQLTIAHFREIIREPGVLFWGIIFPILMSLGLGVAFTTNADTVRKVAVIESQGLSSIDSIISKDGIISDSINKDEGASYTLTLKNDKLGNSVFHFYKMSENEAMLALKRGMVNVLLDQPDKEIRFRFDPRNPDAQLTYLKLAKVFKNSAQFHLENTGNIVPLTLTGTRYIDFLIPGLLAMGIMMSTMWGLSYGMIEKRSKKLLRRMVATPMKKSYFLISLITVRVAMNLVEALLLALFAWLVFHITIQGSIVALILVFIASNIAFAGLAVLISCRTAKTEIGNGLINVVVMPMMLLSGIFFSYHNFPDKLIPVLQKLPLTLVADAMRSIFIEGAGISQIIVPTLVLTIGGIITFIVGLKFFRWY
jgi:ABC-2 type transport system permease protein